MPYARAILHSLILRQFSIRNLYRFAVMPNERGIVDTKADTL